MSVAIGRRTPAREVVALGIVSLCMGVASFMVLGLLPAFVVRSLGASALWVGAIEGVAEGAASLVKVFSGALSDRIGRRKPLVLAGYGLAACMKALFPLAQAPVEVLAIRALDRVGKGLRDAPRDALVADLTEPATRGWHFGLRFALFSVGAMSGPVAAMLLMATSGDNYRAVFAAAILPAALSVLALTFVNEPRRPARLDRTIALRLWTEGSAWFSTEDGTKGRIAPGQYADLAVLSADYFAVREDAIKLLTSVLTVVGGRVVHGDAEFKDMAPPLPLAMPDWSPVRTYGCYHVEETPRAAQFVSHGHGPLTMPRKPANRAMALADLFGCGCFAF